MKKVTVVSGLPLLVASHVSRPKLLPWICLLLCLLNVIVAVYQHSYAFSRRESVNLFSVFVDVGQRNVEAEKVETILKHVLFVVGRFFGRDKFPVEIFASCIGIGVDISTIGVGDRCRWMIY